jgi:hypothetical protein
MASTDYVSQQAIWQTWVNASNTSTVTINPYYAANNTLMWQNWNEVWVPKAPAILKSRKMQRAVEEAALKELERAKRIEEARVKANNRLMELLDSEQQKDLKNSGIFYLTVGERRYKIMPGSVVTLMGVDGQPESSFCIHPTTSVPAADWAIAQKLMLETDEPGFLRIANRRDLRVHAA